jgi:hypothetical protein
MHNKPKAKTFDPKLASLVAALSRLKGIRPIRSDSHLVNPGPHVPANLFCVEVEVAWSQDGHLALSFLSYLINAYLMGQLGAGVQLLPSPAPDFMFRGPGEGLVCDIEGFDDMDPDELATYIDRTWHEFTTQHARPAAQNSK